VSDRLRIASLLASGTEIAVALGLEDEIVAISHECDYPGTILDRPRVSRPRFEPDGLSSGEIDAAVREAMLEHGSVYEVDAALLESLHPTLILTQAVCEVCAVPTPGVQRIVEQRNIDARVLSLDAHTIDEILDSILEVGSAADVMDRAQSVVATMRERLANVRRSAQNLERPTVLGIEWLDPVFAPGHWVPEMIGIAGGECLAGETGGHSRQIEWSVIEGMDPDVLIVMPCGYGVDASRKDADRFADRLLRIAPRAIENGSAWVVDGSSFFNRSGPRVIDGIEILAHILHPDALGDPDPATAQRWQPAGAATGRPSEEQV
jgi:iron complex transport system substrate-binding protein